MMALCKKIEYQGGEEKNDDDYYYDGPDWEAVILWFWKW
jgi:hypothetical protein